jgi:hypothetical protein
MVYVSLLSNSNSICLYLFSTANRLNSFGKRMIFWYGGLVANFDSSKLTILIVRKYR